MELTSGFVAGIIAAGLLIAKLLAPTAITFILASNLNNRETAATWTAVSPPLQASFWPMLLRADTAHSGGVRSFVRFVVIAITSFSLLISVASVLTPLGLYEEEGLSDDASVIPFKYVQDKSPVFSGTSNRNGELFNRRCYLDPNGSCRVPCPYDQNNGTVFFNGTYPEDIYPGCVKLQKGLSLNVTVSDTLREIYNSGTSGRATTISSFFDIEWRQLAYKRDNQSNNGAATASGAYRFLESFALTNDFNVIEGLIVDAKNGGIGFRNHTVPDSPNRTSFWSEDILFMEPSTTCVNQNVSLDFNISVSSDGYSGLNLTGLALTDHGGFANFTRPDSLFSYQDDARETINTPNLQARAYMASWYGNALMMLLLNITNLGNETSGLKQYSYVNSEVGKQFKLSVDSVPEAGKYQMLEFLLSFGDLFAVDYSRTRGNNTAFLGLKNPWQIQKFNFTTPMRLCEDSYATYPTKLNYTYTMCHNVRGVPRRIDPGPAFLFEDGSSWTSPLYTCATGIRATIKTVQFTYNGTATGIEGLRVQDVQEKNYSSKADMPLWGVEDTYLQISEIARIWGLVDDKYGGAKNVSTIRQPWLYLPAGLFRWEDWLDGSNLKDNLPAGIAPVAAMNAIRLTSKSTNSLFDFVGQNSMSLWLKWRDLSTSADSVTKIVKLLWTDAAASAMVGTKGVLGHYNNEPDRATNIKVRQMVRKVKYHYLFGIPAYLAALCLFLITMGLLLTCITRGLHFNLVGQRLKQTSLGRVLTTATYRDNSDFAMTSKEWNRRNGGTLMDLDPIVEIKGVDETHDVKANPKEALLQRPGLESKTM